MRAQSERWAVGRGIVGRINGVKEAIAGSAVAGVRSALINGIPIVRFGYILLILVALIHPIRSTPGIQCTESQTPLSIESSSNREHRPPQTSHRSPLPALDQHWTSTGTTAQRNSCSRVESQTLRITDSTETSFDFSSHLIKWFDVLWICCA